MSSDDIARLGALALGDALARRDLTAVEATKGYLARIERIDPTLQAFVTLDAERALGAAEEADARLSAGRGLGPLDGVPFAVKDNIAVAGLPSTSGVRGRHAAIADEDAFCVTLLKEQGCVLLGTLNMHEGALGATTDNIAYGRCLNPWGVDDQLTPGGSSGGSGAAVAAGLCAFALGTDTMGSVRIPAAYCGVYGFKPSYGRISSDGLSHLSWTLDHIGPLARSAKDLRALMATLAIGHTGAVVTKPSVDYREFWLDEPVHFAGLTIGALVTDIAVEPAVQEAYEQALERLAALGAQVEPVRLDIESPAKLRRKGLLISEAEGAVAFAAERAMGGDALTPDFRALLDYGANQPGERLASAYHGVLAARAAVEKQLAFQGIDLLVSPTAPQRAFPQGGPVPSSQADFTCLANVCDLPAASIPLAVDGLPIGLQVMGPSWSDPFVLRVAIRLEREFGAATLAPV